MTKKRLKTKLEIPLMGISKLGSGLCFKLVMTLLCFKAKVSILGTDPEQDLPDPIPPAGSEPGLGVLGQQAKFMAGSL